MTTPSVNLGKTDDAFERVGPGAAPVGIWFDTSYFRTPGLLTNITAWATASGISRIVGLRTTFTSDVAPMHGDSSTSNNLRRMSMALAPGEVVVSGVSRHQGQGYAPRWVLLPNPNPAPQDSLRFFVLSLLQVLCWR